MLLWYHGRMFYFLNNATTCNVLKPANLCTGSGYKLVDLKIPSGYVCFEPTLARMEEQRIGQNQDLKPGIARSSNCRFESGRSEIVIRYFRLMLKGNPCLYFLIFKFVSSFLNQVFSFYNQILNFFLANMIWYCSKRIFHLRVKQLIQFKFFFQIAFILFRNNLTDIIKFIYFQFIFQNININYFLIFSLQSPKTK